MARAVIYVRVSTTDQVDNYSLETQETECRKYCEREGLIVDRLFREEGESAKTVNRTELQEMLRYLTSHAKKREITHVVVYRVDRLAREVGGHHTIKTTLSRLNVILQSVMERFDETPTGKLTENLMAVLAQFDNDLRSQRSRDGMMAAVAHGRWLWHAPVGYLRTKVTTPSMIIDPVLGPVVQEMFRRTAHGVSKEETRLWAGEHGFLTSTGKPLHASQFHRLITNPIYTGMIVLPKWGISKQGDFEPLVDRELFRMANHTIKGGGKRARERTREHPDFPLRNVVRCGQCEWPLTASWSTNHQKKRYAYYRCRNKDCRGTKVPKSQLEGAFFDWLGEASLPPSFFDALYLMVQEYLADTHKEVERAKQTLVKRLEELSVKESKLMDTYLSGAGISEAVFTKHLRAIEEQRIALQDELGTVIADDLDVDAVIEKGRRILGDLQTSWNSLEPIAHKAFLRFLVPNGVRYENGRVGTAFDPYGIRGIAGFTDDEKRLARPTGFEPVLPP